MLYLTIGIVATALAIYSMMNIAMAVMSKGKRIAWFALAALVPIVGPIIYFVAGPKNKPAHH